jgi:translation initiation factor IF-3
LRVNKQIRAPKIRVIDEEGNQLGVLLVKDALKKAEDAGKDLVEVAPNANPPVCKIIDFGKFRYDQTKREKESKKSHVQIKVKEIKLKPNIDDHDLLTKLRHAKDFLEKGNKVKITLMYRGREMAHKEYGEKLVQKVIEELKEDGIPESIPKQMGRFLTLVIAPQGKKK